MHFPSEKKKLPRDLNSVELKPPDSKPSPECRTEKAKIDTFSLLRESQIPSRNGVDSTEHQSNYCSSEHKSKSSSKEHQSKSSSTEHQSKSISTEHQSKSSSTEHQSKSSSTEHQSKSSSTEHQSKSSSTEHRTKSTCPVCSVQVPTTNLSQHLRKWGFPELIYSKHLAFFIDKSLLRGKMLQGDNFHFFFRILTILICGFFDNLDRLVEVKPFYLKGMQTSFQVPFIFKVTCPIHKVFIKPSLY